MAEQLIDVLLFDLWFYLSHRFLLHSRWGYRHIHIVHHRSVDPTPFARNSVHPVEGLLNGTFHVLPVFLIVAFSSVAGERARRSNFVYGSTKAGLDAFYTGLTEALRPSGVVVTVVRPGLVHTRMTEGMKPAPLSTTPEAVAQVVDLAVDFRQRFHRDTLIELWCYRKHGHNEADEPSYTQPQM